MTLAAYSAAKVEQLRRDNARRHLLPFTRYTKQDYEVNWHHRTITSVCDDVILGLTPDPTLDRKNPPKDNPYCVLKPDAPKRVIICVQPRAGKSEIVSRRLPAYGLGRNPDLEVISVTYAADLASLLNRDVQRIIMSPEYQRLFPQTKLNSTNIRTTAQGSYLRNSDIFEIVQRQGRYRSAGIGGGIGGMGGKLNIIDDPFKNRKEADSEVIREAVWRFYTSTFYTRQEANAAIIIMHTRWHDDDLVGRLLELEKNDPTADKWLVISLPSVLDEIPDDPKMLESYKKYDGRALGAVLWPNKYGLDFLHKMKVMNPEDYESLYQQRPIKPGGAMFPIDKWKFIKAEDFTVFNDMVFCRAWDKGGTEGAGSFTSGVLICFDPHARYGMHFIVIDCTRDQYEESRREAMIRNTAALDLQRFDPVHYVIEQEPGSGGKDSALNTGRNTLRGYDVELKPASGRGDKTSHAKPLSAQQKIGNVAILMGDWDYTGFTKRFSRFPAGKDKDDIDAGAMAFNALALGWEESYIVVEDNPVVISAY